MEKAKEYSNGEVTITWEAEKCIHSAICAKGLPKVFRPKDRPWIKIDQAPTVDLVNQVKACPSGALGYYMNDENERI
ncbi:MAG: (4Fe-4S)-binding protein [Gelidibacter sp.]